MGQNFSNLSQNVLGLVALIVSFVALVTTVLQVLQQYFSSAEGYRRCHRSVMGLWAKGTHRRLRFNQFRIEVVFETPVIFAASPRNNKGPIKNKPIYAIDGTPDSYDKTRVMKPLEPKAQERADNNDAKKAVHTADDEKASWVALLSALQLEEKESRKWDRDQRMITPPRRSMSSPPEYSMVIQVQSKKRSWDFIPPSITKPYATSAICHLVELMSMLGLYWKTFDQLQWNLRAEGNGFILTSQHVHGLGVMVVFATTGKSNFKEKRVIPCEEIKELAFGTVPNIFENDEYLKSPDNQSVDLVFGSVEDTRETLESLGCQAATLDSWQKDHKHIFSLSFEIIGMLGKVVRIRGSAFRMIPNPTGDSWSKQVGKKASWRVARLMAVFQDKLKEDIDNRKLADNHHISLIHRQWLAIKLTIAERGVADEAEYSLETKEAIHDALDESTKLLLKKSQVDILSVLVAHITKVVEVLANPQSPLNTIVLAHKEEALLTYYFSKIRNHVTSSRDVKGKAIDTTAVEKEERDILWISLMYRMICWFLLHDFDRHDIKIVPSDLYGSRMPVYIG